MPNQNSEALDRTWPKPLPDDDSIRNVFRRHLKIFEETPEAHWRTVDRFLNNHEKLLYVANDLHRKLSVQYDWNNPHHSGREVIRQIPDSLHIKNMGIDRWADLHKLVFPVIFPTLRQTLWQDEDQKNLDAVALSVGAMLAEAQSFSDANTRIARTIYDFIKGGLGNLSIQSSAKRRRDFQIPDSFEELILLQNVTKLIEYPEEYALSGDIVMVSERARSLYAQERERIDALVYQDYPLSRDYIEQALQLVALNERIDAYTGENTLNPDLKARSVLRQKQYGAGALAAAFLGESKGPLGAERAQYLVEVNYELMRMRVASIGLAMVRNGSFVSIDKQASDSLPTITTRTWVPKSIDE